MKDASMRLRNGIFKRNRISNLIVYFVLLSVVLVNLFPFFNLLLNSFRFHQNIISRPIAFDVITVDNYIEAEKFGHLIRGLINGVVISFLSILILIVLGTMNAYAITFLDFKIKAVLYLYISLGFLIPPAATLIPVFLTLREIHLLNTYIGIVLVYVALYTPVSMIILTGFMKSIPRTLAESASIDGANHFVIYSRIIFPISKSAIVTLVVLLFLWTYREYMWPLILMFRPEKRTIAVALARFVGNRQFNFGALSAAVVVSLLPIMTIYIFLKEHIMSGMVAGSIKG